MKIKRISWQEALPIRHQVLWPDKDLAFCKVEGDEDGIHFAVFLDTKLVSVASIYIDNKNARLRKFASLAEYRNKGFGSQLIAHILQELKEMKLSYFWCDARTSATGFYQKLGMIPDGDVFYKFDLAYIKMGMSLN